MSDLETKYPVRRVENKVGSVSWGYSRDPNDLHTIRPDLEAFAYLEQALDILDTGGSLRETAKWLSEKARRSISHTRLNALWKEQRGSADTPRARKLAGIAPQKPEAVRLRAAKRTVTTLEKKREKKKEKKKRIVVPTEIDEDGRTVVADTLPAEAKQHVIFQPNAGPQTEFLAATEQEVLYGGSAGGGKSYGLLADPVRYFTNANFNGLILRRTTDELRELIWKSKELYPAAVPGAKWSERKSAWTFPRGGSLWLTYLERDEDVLRYQGQAFSYIGVDELTQYATPFAWNYLRSRLRTTDPNLPVFQRATTNPGGPGHGWVKRMFIDPAPAGKAFWATDIDTGQTLVYPPGHLKAGQPLFKRRFIPASLKDNPYLNADGRYEAGLLALPEHQRRQLLEGDWSVAEGAAFAEFRYAHHTCEPFEIPHTWKRFRSCDFGYASHSAVHWYAVDPAFETLYVYRELYVSRLTGRELARRILELEAGEQIAYGVLDSSCWHQRGHLGPSIAEEMIAEGCRWRPSDRTAGARIAGKNRLHELLRLKDIGDGEQRPGIIFFNTCRQIIADLPVIPMDPKGSEDIDSRYASDHTYDSIRYGIMTRPKPFSPFDMLNGSRTYTYTPADPVFGY